MRKRSSKGGGAQRSIQVHLMVNEEEAAMIRAAARKRNQTVSLTIIEAVKLLEGSLYVEEEEHDSPTVQALREIEYQLRRIGRNVNQIAHNANREMNATIEDEASASYAVRQCRELIDHLDAVIGSVEGAHEVVGWPTMGRSTRLRMTWSRNTPGCPQVGHSLIGSTGSASITVTSPFSVAPVIVVPSFAVRQMVSTMTFPLGCTVGP